MILGLVWSFWEMECLGLRSPDCCSWLFLILLLEARPWNVERVVVSAGRSCQGLEGSWFGVLDTWWRHQNRASRASTLFQLGYGSFRNSFSVGQLTFDGKHMRGWLAAVNTFGNQNICRCIRPIFTSGLLGCHFAYFESRCYGLGLCANRICYSCLSPPS